MQLFIIFNVKQLDNFFTVKRNLQELIYTYNPKRKKSQ